MVNDVERRMTPKESKWLINSHGQVADFLKLKKHLKQFILFSGKGPRFIDGITGQTNWFFGKSFKYQIKFLRISLNIIYLFIDIIQTNFKAFELFISLQIRTSIDSIFKSTKAILININH